LQKGNYQNGFTRIEPLKNNGLKISKRLLGLAITMSMLHLIVPKRMLKESSLDIQVDLIEGQSPKIPLDQDNIKLIIAKSI
jgi:hypothetical protein